MTFTASELARSAGARFRQALADEQPLQIVGTINANHALLAKRAGYRAIYLSGGGVAAGSLGLPDLGISGLDDVLTDVRRITDVCDTPLLVDVDTGFGSSAFNVARTTRSLIKAGAGAMHIEDQVGAKRCGHRPNKEIVSQGEMVDRIKAAVLVGGRRLAAGELLHELQGAVPELFAGADVADPSGAAAPAVPAEAPPAAAPARVERQRQAPPQSLAGVARASQAEHIRQVLAQCGGNRTQACHLLGISPTTLWRRLRDAPADEAA